ncbi:hypothetical protein SBOR_3905 [Sclerotinia borealis F-4128]|uniref:Uncharacterized protein n=1 Tax=Sclerotinia borealis (strain F-4128) TaxID=1432307 RepID=W9CMD0_SCLBF|nr:hypothetical protein SBOR_3905 [Sclerotinia borealis F-4128]
MSSVVVSDVGPIRLNVETGPVPISKDGANSIKITSLGSEAVASESKNSSDYRYLMVQHRHDLNPNSSHKRSHQNPETIAPLTHRAVTATIKNPYTCRVTTYTYNEYEPTGAIPIIGFARQLAPQDIELPASRPNEPEEPWMRFPPPADSAYTELGREVEKEYDPHPYDTFDIALDGAGLAIKNTPSPDVPVKSAHTGRRQSTGNMAATGIDFTQNSWIDFEPSVIGEIYSGVEQKADFIRNMDEGAQIEYCKKCKERHIPPGSPITLPERDPCGSYLPEWFPTEGIQKPWYHFKQMINNWVCLVEIEQGYTHNEDPARHFWNLEYHDHHEKWKQIGRIAGQGGWWKCKNGLDATYAERSCRVCTSRDAIEREIEVQLYKQKQTVAQSKAGIENWITNMVKEGGRRDKEAVLATWLANGIPQHYGPPVSRHGIYQVTKGGHPITGVLVPEKRHHLLPEQMFSEKLFKDNAHPPSASQSIDEALNIVVSKGDMESPVSSNTSPTTGIPDAPKIFTRDSGLGSSDGSDPSPGAEPSVAPFADFKKA